jgi:uncharacterized protein (TIGR00369 family)
LKPSEMTGLDLMRLATTLPGNMGDRGISSVIPMKIIEAEEGRVVFLATADGRHTNPLGAVHGGFAATVLDSATGCAIHTLLPAGVGYGTVDLNVKMVRPVPLEQEMIAVGKVIDRTRTMAISEATLTNKDGKIYATATATCRILAPS